MEKPSISIKQEFSPEKIEAEVPDVEKLQDLKTLEVPKNIVEFVTRYGNRFPPFDTREGDFTFSVLTQSNGDLSYIAKHSKTWGNSGDNEEMNYVIDTRDGQIIGRGEIRFPISNQSEYFKDKPFIGFIETEEDFRREGLGKRRVGLMNGLCRKLYGFPLYSDTINSNIMVSLWESLVTEGKARKFKEGPHDRYVYIGQ